MKFLMILTLSLLFCFGCVSSGDTLTPQNIQHSQIVKLDVDIVRKALIAPELLKKMGVALLEVGDTSIIYEQHSKRDTIRYSYRVDFKEDELSITFLESKCAAELKTVLADYAKRARQFEKHAKYRISIAASENME